MKKNKSKIIIIVLVIIAILFIFVGIRLFATIKTIEEVNDSRNDLYVNGAKKIIDNVRTAMASGEVVADDGLCQYLEKGSATVVNLFKDGENMLMVMLLFIIKVKILQIIMIIMFQYLMKRVMVYQILLEKIK